MKKFYIGIGVVTILAMAFGAVTIASADEHNPPQRQRGQKDGPFHELFLENLAEALGTTSDDLQSRIESGEKLPDIAAEYGYEGEALKELMDSVKQATVDEALAEGLITEEEAEKILAHSGRKGSGRRGGKGNPILREYFINNLAEALGLSVDELKAIKEDGQTLEDLGYSEEELKEIFQQAREDAIEEALADGVITEEEVEKFQDRKNKDN